MLPKFDMRDSFLTSLYDKAQQDRDILILSNDFGAPQLDRFRADFPTQFINAAISEQNMISTAAGLAKEGKKVVVYSIMTFVTLRAYEQIKIDLCVMNLPVTILAVGAGYAYSADGPTHHATEDIAVMRALSNLTIYSPSDSMIAANLGRQVGQFKGPTYVRLDRAKWPSLYEENADLSAGLRTLRPGKNRVAIISTGIMVHRALDVAKELEKQGIDARVIDLYRLKPLNRGEFAEAVAPFDSVATIEEQTMNGGLGGLVAEAMADADIVKPLKRFAIADSMLYAYGGRDRLHKERGLDTQSLTMDLADWLQRHKARNSAALEKIS